MVFSTEHKLDMPDSFPAEAMVAFMAVAREIVLKPVMSDVWPELGGAANLIGWRFRASHEDMTVYVRSWETLGGNVPFEDIYLRERCLFGMFSAGVSCIETTCYALYALASHSRLLGLPFGEDEQRRCSPARLRDRLQGCTPTPALADTLDILVASKEWAVWVDLRNRMTHRTPLPRIVEAAIGTEPPPPSALHFAATTSTPAIKADISRLDALFSWLAQSLCALLVDGRTFAIEQTKPQAGNSPGLK